MVAEYSYFKPLLRVQFLGPNVPTYVCPAVFAFFVLSTGTDLKLQNDILGVHICLLCFMNEPNQRTSIGDEVHIEHTEPSWSLPHISCTKAE